MNLLTSFWSMNINQRRRGVVWVLSLSLRLAKASHIKKERMMVVVNRLWMTSRRISNILKFNKSPRTKHWRTKTSSWRSKGNCFRMGCLWILNVTTKKIHISDLISNTMMTPTMKCSIHLDSSNHSYKMTYPMGKFKTTTPKTSSKISWITSRLIRSLIS